jgi:hypothetical protein
MTTALSAPKQSVLEADDVAERFEPPRSASWLRNALRAAGSAAWKSIAVVLFLLLWEYGPKYLVD